MRANANTRDIRNDPFRELIVRRGAFPRENNFRECEIYFRQNVIVVFLARISKKRKRKQRKKKERGIDEKNYTSVLLWVLKIYLKTLLIKRGCNVQRFSGIYLAFGGKNALVLLFHRASQLSKNTTARGNIDILILRTNKRDDNTDLIIHIAEYATLLFSTVPWKNLRMKNIFIVLL